ncbi:hypothetical protein PF010_g21777 [Phytophthora fragariae]|uniref:Uncharacterized protein n=1 Tax=Phytophthora fragariae TaxID=53985 RepID=A0A6A4A499_9STRA|nr:hypothetical protein PF010_g21777 [Phytophthora fragariae]KAE9251316.1 hypothetical protein PF002_g4346 [Phytophthora fragariae]
MATSVSRPSGSLPVGCDTVATPTDVSTISTHTAGKAPSRGSSRSSSTDTTDPIAVTAITDSTPEEIVPQCVTERYESSNRSQ